MAGEHAWWHAKGSERFGPHTEEELRQKLADGQVSASDLVWAEGMTDWVPAATVEGLVPPKKEVRAAGQPPPLPVAPPPVAVAATPADAGWSASSAMPGASLATGTDNHPRVYHAPRLDRAFDAQPQIVKIGKLVAPLATLMTFAVSGAGWGILALIGLAAYWMTLLKNKGDLEQIEKTLHGQHAKDGLPHDLTDLALLRYRFGPGLAFFGSILAVIFILAKWGLRFIWEYRNG
ncbi:protein of unknown function [Solimonas aquatica]|uniref:GYF domain-containing protein n=1 Tax=Solimonas aquatica TaxID=489703 RepID=A0A1H9GJR4_9GAMM|nr:DUF4339 domain-containing protein [Solimonas aquatica]SEQ50138.1 protein of unknown function [Solimonas aquatica]